jgi:hypothetical protein
VDLAREKKLPPAPRAPRIALKQARVRAAAGKSRKTSKSVKSGKRVAKRQAGGKRKRRAARS